MVKDRLRSGLEEGKKYELREEHIGIRNFLASEMRRRGLYVEETTPLKSKSADVKGKGPERRRTALRKGQKVSPLYRVACSLGLLYRVACSLLNRCSLLYRVACSPQYV